jgi:hydrogenase maturation protease
MNGDKVISQVSELRPGIPNSVTHPNISQSRCLILACGNTLREDDGVGPFLAEWAEERWRGDSRVRILCDHQWTPEMVEEVASAATVVFVDCSGDAAPGAIQARVVEPTEDISRLGTHHLDAAQLLALSGQLYGSMPRNSLLLTVGAGSLELREGLSDAVRAALPEARRMLERSVLHMLNETSDQRA